jgi:hypothetical protein
MAGGAAQGVPVVRPEEEAGVIDTEDDKLLRACVAWAREQDELDDWQQKWLEAFDGMLRRGKPLSEMQRQYVQDVHEKLFDEPHAQNLWSRGLVPEGASLRTPVPAVLLAPLKKFPPGRTK